MIDVAAKGVKYVVVSVKKPDHYILRGIVKWTTPEALRTRMEKYVAIEDSAELEWTFHEYFLPHYMAYGSGDIPQCDWYGDGVYIHRYVDYDTYGPATKLEAM